MASALSSNSRNLLLYWDLLAFEILCNCTFIYIKITTTIISVLLYINISIKRYMKIKYIKFYLCFGLYGINRPHMHEVYVIESEKTCHVAKKHIFILFGVIKQLMLCIILFSLNVQK